MLLAYVLLVVVHRPAEEDGDGPDVAPLLDGGGAEATGLVCYLGVGPGVVGGLHGRIILSDVALGLRLGGVDREG